MTWLERKLATLCARRGCTCEPCEDHNLCADHRDEHRERNRRWKRALRLYAANAAR